MAELVEGDWKDFTFKMATPEDYPDILEHLRANFYVDEPINRYLGQGELKTKDMDTTALAYMEQGLSFFVIHKPTQKVVGARITGISKKGENYEEILAVLESQETKDLIPNFLQQREEANIFERYGIDTFGDFLFVSVDKKFRGQGLATEMYNRAIKLLKSKGITAAESTFTSSISQSIATKLGFVELCRKKLVDFKTLDGQQLMPDAGDEEWSIVMVKLI